MKPIALAVLVGTCASLLVGCVTGSHIVTGTVRPAILPEGVKIYGTMPANAEVIATVTASYEDSGQSATDMCIKELRKQAGKVGANGVVIGGLQATPGQTGYGFGTGVSSSGGVVTTSGGFSTSPTTTVNGTAIYVPAQ